MSCAVDPGLGEKRRPKSPVSFRVCGGVELQHARHAGRRFLPHLHEEYQLMVVSAGALRLRVAEAEYRVGPGQVCAIAPGEVHAGRSDGWGWECRNFYVPVALMEAVAADLGLARFAFAAPVLRDPMLARALASAHAAASEVGDAGAGQLEEALGLLIIRNGVDAAPEPSGQRRSTRRAQAYIRAHHAERISLDELAALASMSKFHFLRVFARETNLTPHAFQTQARVAHALRALRRGAGVAEAASEAGFADQSHLTRSVQRSHGLTPGLIRRAH